MTLPILLGCVFALLATAAAAVVFLRGPFASPAVHGV
jgi:hypothetical protein